MRREFRFQLEDDSRFFNVNSHLLLPPLKAYLTNSLLQCYKLTAPKLQKHDSRALLTVSIPKT